MVLNDLAMLAVPNNRSKYYLETLLSQQHAPSHVLVLYQPDTLTPGQTPEDLGGGFVRFLQDQGIGHSLLPTVDVNSAMVLEALRDRPEGFVLYSGPGGAILKKRILGEGKRFLHIHPGRLPDFRGSTTVYYHLLEGDTCGVSAFFLERKLDAGPIVATREYPFHCDTDLDYEFDPQIRARLLGEVIAHYAEHGDFPSVEQAASTGETYYIMHPVLRHIAKLKLAGLPSEEVGDRR